MEKMENNIESLSDIIDEIGTIVVTVDHTSEQSLYDSFSKISSVVATRASSELYSSNKGSWLSRKVKDIAYS
jgi:hypothetical protein